MNLPVNSGPDGNIAFPSRFGDLIVGNAELAKLVDSVLVYSKADAPFLSHCLLQCTTVDHLPSARPLVAAAGNCAIATHN